MLFTDFFIWWYGRGWALRVAELQHHLSNWAQFFSFGILLKTLFKPWKQIVTRPGPNGGLAAKRNALIDNLVSRFVGFFVRVTVLFVAVIVMLFVLLFNTLYVLLWPVLPLLPIILIVVGISV